MYSLRDAVRDQTGLSPQDWIDSMLNLNLRELQKAIWRLDRCKLVDNEFARKSGSIANDDEVVELTGAPPIAGVLLDFWPCDGWDMLTSKADKTTFLLKSLEEKINSWNGLPWRRMRSSMLEAWLKSSEEVAFQAWRRWLV